MPCKYCGLGGIRVGDYLGREPKVGEPRYAIIGDFPNDVDILRNKPMSGPPGDLLREVLKQAGIDVSCAYLTNVFCCAPDTDKELTTEQIDFARTALFEDLEWFKPDRILCLGAKALQAVCAETGKKGESIIHIRGLWRDVTVGGRKVPTMPTVSPGLLMHRPSAFIDFTRDIDRFGKPIVEYPIPKFILIDKYEHTPLALQLLKDTSKSNVRAYDIETTGFDFHSRDIICLGIKCRGGDIIIYSEEAMASDWIVKHLQDVAQLDGLEWVGHNSVTFDQPFITTKIGVEWPNTRDTMLAHWSVDERQGTHGLKDIARDVLGINDYEAEVTQYLDNTWGYKFAPRDVLYKYLAYDVDLTDAVDQWLQPQMSEGKLQFLHDKVLCPIAKMYGEIRPYGIKLDRTYLEKLGEEWGTEVEKLKLDLQLMASDIGFIGKFKRKSDITPELLNPNSTQQLRTVLYELLGLPKLEKDRLRALPVDAPLEDTSTDKTVIGELLRRLGDDPEKNIEREFLTKQQTYRRLVKLRSTYVLGWLRRMDDRDRIYPRVLVHGTQTGRVAYNESMNQIPKRDAEGREKMGLVPYAKQIRYAFLADEGESYLSCDYSQLEMKVAAYLSEDENMIADLSHTDFHAATAAGMFGKAVEDVTAEERAKGKTQNFAVLYRQSDASTAFSLKITEEEAKRSRLRYEDRYSKLTKFMQSNVDNVQKRGWVETFWGNRGRYPFIPDYGILAEMQRQAANLPVQGTAFYICALSAVRIHNEFDPKDLRVVMTIHDEINSLCRDEILTESAARVKEIMENPPYLEDRGVKFSADMKIRKRWAEI